MLFKLAGDGLRRNNADEIQKYFDGSLVYCPIVVEKIYHKGVCILKFDEYVNLKEFKHYYQYTNRTLHDHFGNMTIMLCEDALPKNTIRTCHPKPRHKHHHHQQQQQQLMKDQQKQIKSLSKKEADSLYYQEHREEIKKKRRMRPQTSKKAFSYQTLL